MYGILFNEHIIIDIFISFQLNKEAFSINIKSKPNSIIEFSTKHLRHKINMIILATLL